MNFRTWYLWKGGLPFASLLGRLFWPRPSAGAVVTHDEAILAVDTGEYLMLPVGGLQYGETFADAARREAREETGLDVRINEQLDQGVNAYGGVEVLFAGEPASEVLAPDPSWEGRPTWIPFEEVPHRTWRFDRPVAEYLDDR